jgi:hypothetical protein
LEPTKLTVKPQIKHPNAEQKRKKNTPLTAKSTPPEGGFQRSDSESSSNRSSIDESRGGISDTFTPFSPTQSFTAPDGEFYWNSIFFNFSFSEFGIMTPGFLHIIDDFHGEENSC